MTYFYIASSKKSVGEFEVVQKGYETESTFDFYMRHKGNFFSSKEAAEKVCTKINKLIWANGVSFKDKKGNKVHIGDSVTIDKEVMAVDAKEKTKDVGGTTVTVLTIAKNGEHFCFLDEKGKEWHIKDLDKTLKK